MPPEQNIDSVVILNALIKSHIESCQSFKKYTITCAGIAITMAISALGYFVSTIDNLKDENKSIAATFALLERRDDTNREEMSGRLASIVAANIQREESVNQRFSQLRNDIVQMRTDFRETILTIKKGSKQ